MPPQFPLLHGRRALAALALSINAVALAPALAADPPDTVLVRRGDIVITRADWDVELLRIPAKDRADFASNTRRNLSLLERMLTTRELAQKAREQKLDADPMTRTRVQQEADRILAAAMLARAEEAAALDFELKRPAWERRARELYEIDRARFATPETVMITLLHFSAARDGSEGAQKRAADALAKIKAGADIGDLAAALSDDPTTREVRGRKGPLARADIDATLANAAFALKSRGEISQAIPTREGSWIVRLDERRPPVPRSFDEVRGEMLAEMKQKYVETARADVLAGVGGDKEVVVNQPAIDALRTAPNR